MSYEDAIRQFKENVNLLSGTNNKADNLMWNLSAGLANIAEGLSYDLREIESQLADVLQRLDQIESK